MRPYNITTIADRWKESHTKRWQQGREWTEKRQAIHAEIVAAGANIEKIDAAIGNGSWTQFHCAECDKYKRVGMEFDNGDGGYVVICSDCLREGSAQCDAFIA